MPFRVRGCLIFDKKNKKEKHSPYKFVAWFFFQRWHHEATQIFGRGPVEDILDSKSAGESGKDAQKTKFVICCFSIPLIISTTYQTYLGFNFLAKTRVNSICLNYLRKGEDSRRHQSPSPHLQLEPTALYYRGKKGPQKKTLNCLLSKIQDQAAPLKSVIISATNEPRTSFSQEGLTVIHGHLDDASLPFHPAAVRRN